MPFSNISPAYHNAPISHVVLYPVLTIDDLLLANPKRHNFFSRLSQHSGLEPEMHQTLYDSVIKQFVELVQAIPYQVGGKPGGLMDYSLTRAGTALRHYRQSAGTDFSPLYAYALFTAALFQDVGKVISQQTTIISDGQGKFIAEWQPLEGSLVKLKAEHYKLRTTGDQWVSLGQSLTPLLARQSMPEPGFEWIASDYKILAMWMGVLTGDAESEGDLIHWLHLSYELIRDLPKKDQLIEFEIQPTRPTETAIGEDFIAWLSGGLENGSIPINTEDAMAHAVLNGLLLIEAEMVKKFAKMYGKGTNFEVICKQVNDLGIAPLSGEDTLFEKFFAKLPGINNALRNPKGGLFFNLGGVAEGSVMENQGVREGLLIRSDMVYRKELSTSNFLTPTQVSLVNNATAFEAKKVEALKIKLADWSRQNPIKRFSNN